MPADEGQRPNGDIDKLYEIANRNATDIARIASTVESNAENTKQSISNITERISDLVSYQRSQRPQLGAIAALFISGAALVVTLASFALKSNVAPMQHDYIALEKRVDKAEDQLKVRTSDQDDMQNARIDYVYTVIEDFHRLLLEVYVGGSVSGASHATQPHTQ